MFEIPSDRELVPVGFEFRFQCSGFRRREQGPQPTGPQKIDATRLCHGTWRPVKRSALGRFPCRRFHRVSEQTRSWTEADPGAPSPCVFGVLSVVDFHAIGEPPFSSRFGNAKTGFCPISVPRRLLSAPASGRRASTCVGTVVPLSSAISMTSSTMLDVRRSAHGI